MLRMCTWYAADPMRSSPAWSQATRTSRQSAAGPVETREVADAKIVADRRPRRGLDDRGRALPLVRRRRLPAAGAVRHEGSAAGVQIDLEPLARAGAARRSGGRAVEPDGGTGALLGRRADEVAERLHGAAGPRSASRCSTRCSRRALAGAATRAGPTCARLDAARAQRRADADRRAGGGARLLAPAPGQPLRRRHRRAAEAGGADAAASSAPGGGSGARRWRAWRPSAATPTRRTSRASSRSSRAGRRRRSRSFKTARADAA